MARTNKRTSADAPGEQPATPKRRRRRIVWDHRRDKYLLLAIFAHMNVKAPDFQEIADMLGNETYSADTLTRRFRVLKQIATEVMEDRHDKGLGVLEEEITERDHDVTIVDEPAISNPAPQLPTTPSSVRSGQAVAESTSLISQTSTPPQRPNPHPRGPHAEPKHSRPPRREQAKPPRQQEPHRPNDSRAKHGEPAISSPNSDRLNHIRRRIRQRNQIHATTVSPRGVANEPSNESQSARQEPAYIPLGLNSQANSSRNWSAAGPARPLQPYFGNGGAYGVGGGGGLTQFVFPSIEH
ncbi:hypothetical protein ASPVEDRAFT_78150 [Aspergillus versicolor CBS 583.65]|uniref:Uncharacterized protein n=1 Tax=Aspergillus versicolor CBS 583.65 TaxID=1036611 RepID=A0A1L9P4E9_ASPVE|nr:uncharacterized protein ASPVEDRAFT_78150 [Aspergillus versicolor CBS 583.65]OJI96376.1 hypothetical protein ASPVEDRAFT_78150 [Aspergillus versicolor CBS 583.65]